jgi:ribosomal subunit interface protein
MNITIKGKHVDIGDALNSHANEHLSANVKKYFENALDSMVVFSRDGHMFHVDITVHTRRSMVMKGNMSAGDAYAAFDGALAKITKQLRRYKRKLNNHHKNHNDEAEQAAQYSIIHYNGDDEEINEDAPPIIIAEMDHKISTLTVSEAVMQMDLANAPTIMFRNRAHGCLNVVYRRADGNVGWIDPVDNDKRS